MARIAMVGTGYVGLVTGVVFAELGHEVVGVDLLRERVARINRGEPPIHEDGLAELMARNVPERFRATTDIAEAMDGAAFVFIAVGTPSREDGSIDLSHVERASADIAPNLRPGQIVVVKSTVVPGTTRDVVRPILKRGAPDPGSVRLAMVPEFLREGIAVRDAMSPGRIVIGAEDRSVASAVAALFTGTDAPVLVTDPTTAEAIKYASNTLLALKISYANEIGALCEDLGIDVYRVMEGVGMDPRMSRYFLNAGLGFGGSCLPKDTRALRAVFADRGLEPLLLDALHAVNDRQALRAVSSLDGLLGGLRGKRVAVMGVAFKANTDDVRETRAVPVIMGLLQRGAEVVVHDPIASNNLREMYRMDVAFATTAREALEGSDAVVLQTDWPEYSELDASAFEKMRGRVVYDGRRALSATQVTFLRGRGFTVFLHGAGVQ
ncbi:MAG: UDP-glucose/GDP-mannose dehydrogenase family protein [Thermoplasmata archaeon]|nr:UDP-glucose/GDP-mannose dehydrogenase family protein [Thermoplasmata archaeon]